MSSEDIIALSPERKIVKSLEKKIAKSCEDFMLCTIFTIDENKLIIKTVYKLSERANAEKALSELESGLFLDFYNTISTVDVNEKFTFDNIIISFTGRGKRYNEVCGLIEERLKINHSKAAVIVHKIHGTDSNKRWAISHIKRPSQSFFFDDELENVVEVSKLNNSEKSIKCFHFNPNDNLAKTIKDIYL